MSSRSASHQSPIRKDRDRRSVGRESGPGTLRTRADTVERRARRDGGERPALSARAADGRWRPTGQVSQPEVPGQSTGAAAAANWLAYRAAYGPPAAMSESW